MGPLTSNTLNDELEDIIKGRILSGLLKANEYDGWVK
jgi:hypothetical protein